MALKTQRCVELLLVCLVAGFGVVCIACIVLLGLTDFKVDKEKALYLIEGVVISLWFTGALAYLSLSLESSIKSLAAAGTPEARNSVRRQWWKDMRSGVFVPIIGSFSIIGIVLSGSGNIVERLMHFLKTFVAN